MLNDPKTISTSTATMTILVTGAAGFIGSHLSESLLAKGHQLILLDNFDPFYAKSLKQLNLATVLNHDDVQFIEGDVRDKELLTHIFNTHKINLVIHLAAKAGVRPSVENPEAYVDVNINGTLNLLECMRRANIRKMIFASSSSIYGNNPKLPFAEHDRVDEPISPYAATKRSAELLCHTYAHLFGMDISCLRFFTVFGPRQRPDLAIHKFTKLIHEGKPIPFYGNGGTARDYTYIDDIISGILQAMQQLGGFSIYNLGQSYTVTLTELVTELAKIIGQPALINSLPMQTGDVQTTLADISKARSELGYDPKTTLVQGLQHFVNWYLESKKKTPVEKWNA